MSTPLRVLILEDCPTDAELMAVELKKPDFAPAWQRVETEQAFLAALDQPLDLILADHALPQYDSARALDALKQRGLDVPFIIVSGSIDEELAVGLMKKGAADYVSKDRLARLGIVVANALQQRQLREEKRQAEQKLRDSEAWFRALLDRSHDAVVVIDRAGRIQYASPGVVRVLGQTPQEYIGSDVFARVHPDDLPRARQLFEDLLRQSGQTVTALFRAQHKDGSCRWVEASATSLLDQPPIDAIVVNYRDVTERKAAEDQLRLQSKAMEAATLGIVITDRQGTIVYVNPAFTAMTGYGREEALGQNTRILKSGKHSPQLYREMWETILAGQVWQGELTNQRKDGSLYTEVMSITPVRDEHGEITHFIAIKQDVTERKKLEAQFLQAQKMETFGQLAGGVAHDFNNLLTVITGFSQLLLSGTVSKEQTTEMLGEINKAAERAAGLTGQLLAFSRKQMRQPQVLDLNTLVAEQEKMLRRLIGEDIQLVVQRDPELHRIYADSCQIQQVILNLAVNARDAMPRGGTLTISTRNVELDEAFAWAHPRVQPGPHVLLEVRDTGCGMTPEVMARIFEPFFTTKGTGRGTGLGLPTVLGIVEQSDGVIEVESQPGLGSTFRVYLPRSLASPSGTRKQAPPLPSGKETILLVEDDPGVRGLAALILRNAGYTVQEASTGAEAVETIRCSQRAIDLLLTDVVMPGMNGPELVNALGTSNRAPKVLYMSGYLDETVVRHGVREGLDLLQKPLTPAALLRKVREVLDRNQTQDGIDGGL